MKKGPPVQVPEPGRGGGRQVACSWRSRRRVRGQRRASCGPARAGIQWWSGHLEGMRAVVASQGQACHPLMHRATRIQTLDPASQIQTQTQDPAFWIRTHWAGERLPGTTRGPDPGMCMLGATLDPDHPDMPLMGSTMDPDPDTAMVGATTTRIGHWQPRLSLRRCGCRRWWRI